MTTGPSDARPSLDETLAHPAIARLAGALARRPGTHAVLSPGEPVPREAAVAAVLRVDETVAGGVELLFIRRAEFAGDPWSGQIAFPGGRREPGDASLRETAVRETREELALDLALDGRLLGTLDDLNPRNPALPAIVVRPFVFAAAPRAPLMPSHEVAAALWMPVSALLAREASVLSVVRPRGVDMHVPSVVHGGHVIWGMTERMLRQLLARFAEDHILP